MPYVDGFVLTVPRKKLAAYRRMAKAASKIFRELGALEFHESVGDDLNTKMGVSFPRMAKARPGEAVLFSWILYKSRADRDRVNKKMMTDKRIARMMKGPMPFDVKRMAMGGFKTIVDA
jgi:uncharacterized protein YbaA (DUF1428 family)